MPFRAELPAAPSGRILLAVCLLLTATPLNAQRREPTPANPARLPSQLSLDLRDDRAGLPQNSVQAIAQTTDGYIWLGTQQGVARFDGARFTILDRQSRPALEQPYVWALEADPRGGLWIGTEEGGLSHLKDGRITKIQGLPSPWVRSLHVDPTGTLWIGTQGGGLARLRNGSVEPVSLVAGMEPKNIYAFADDDRGNVWVGFGGGLARMTPQGPVVLTVANGLPAPTALALAPAPGGGMYVGTGKGLALVRGDSVVRTWTTADGLPDEIVYRLRVDVDGTLWMGTHQGLARLIDGEISTIGPETDIHPDIQSLEIDHEGSLWVGTYGGGLARLRTTPFTPIGKPEGLADDLALPILQDRHGHVWVGSAGGLDRITPDGIRNYSAAQGHLPEGMIFALAEGPDGAIWIGMATGLTRLAETGESRTWTSQDGIAQGFVRGIAFDAEGVMWLATPAGLQRFMLGPVETFTTENGLPDDFVLTVAPARGGGLWVGTRAGLSRMQDGRFQSWPVEGGVGAVYDAPDGTVWTAGSQGMSRLQGGRLVHADQDDGLCDDMVTTVVADGRGRLWMGSNRGIFMLTPAEFDAWAAGRTPTLTCRLYGREYGMRSRELNGAINPAGWRTTDGRLWFPTLKGVVVVDPEHLEAGLVAPPVMIEALVAEGVAPGLVQRLPAGTRSLDVQFTAATFVSPERVRFRYRLDPVDRGWVEVVNRRTASYSNLGPGRYTFRVMAMNAEGDWNEVAATHAFTIAPLFWETHIFRATIALAIIALLALLYRRRVRTLQRRQHELVLLVEERTRAEARYRDLFENATDAVFTTDLDGRFTALNRRAVELTGYPVEEALALNIRALLPPSEASERVAREWLDGGADGARTVEIVAHDGTRIPVEVSTRVVKDGGVPVGIQALARDVRDRTALELQLRQSQKMQAVGQLAGGVAHDFNNLLTVIRGNGEILLAQNATNADARVDLEQIVAAAERASALTRQLLAFSRRQVVQPVDVDINELVLRLERMMHRLIGEDIRIALRLTKESAWVCADPGQLEQVLVNLAVNARDAMPRGGTLTISTSIIPVDDVPHAPVAASSGRCVLLTVTDTGTGMDAATINRIFEPFFTTKEAGKGTGLGLSTVYGIVEQAGGQIVCQSEPGHGTTFRIYLPAIAVAASRAETAAARGGNWRGTETILLVEDDPAVRGLTRRILARYGYTVLETGDGAAAIRMADEHAGPIDLVLTDMVMPTMNGREVAARLRERRPDARVLLMSGYTDDEILRRGLHDTSIAFLQKPFTPDDLGRAVRETLDREGARRSA